MINNKIWGLVGLAARARKICFGADSVEQEMKKKKVKFNMKYISYYLTNGENQAYNAM